MKSLSYDILSLSETAPTTAIQFNHKDLANATLLESHVMGIYYAIDVFQKFAKVSLWLAT